MLQSEFYQSLQSLLSNLEVIDLSVMVSDDYPCYWPTITGYHASVWHRHDGWRGHFFTRYLIMEEHTGTHCDAPAHFIPEPETGLPHATEAGKITAEKLQLQRLIGPAVVVDCRSLRGKAKAGISPIITVEFLERWQRENGEFSSGDIVLFHTGWSDDYYKPFPEGLDFGHNIVIEKKAPAWPAPDGETVSYLADLGVMTIGCDTNSMGPLQNDPEPHWAGLGRGMIFVERLINLHKLPTRGALFIFLPLKLEGGSGAPGRAIALIK